MLLTKRIIIALVLVLVVLSINHDLSKGTKRFNSTITKEPETKTINFTIVQLQILQGETFLTIIEQINPLSFNELDIEQLINDFISLNPQADPHQLIIGETYYFPKY